MPRVAAVLLACLIAAPAGAGAQTIGSIRVESKNVFDPAVPGEDLWLFRVANWIHFVSRDAVLEREVLQAPGEAFDELRAQETERNLRAFPFIRSAEASMEGSTLVLRTQDAWTTKLVSGLGREGGEDFAFAGIEESSVFGYGKTASYIFDEQGDQRRHEVRYVDPRLVGSDVRLIGLYSGGNITDEWGLDLKRDFLSLRSPYAFEVNWLDLRAERRLYQFAQETTRFEQRHRRVRALGRVKVYERGVWAHRAALGWDAEKHQFASLTRTASGTLPPDREHQGPVAGWSWSQAKYIEKRNINTAGRVEDFNLGNEFDALVGWLPAKWSGGRDQTLFEARMRQGARLGEDDFVVAAGGVRGRQRAARVEDVLWYGSVNLISQTETFYPKTWIFHFEAALASNLAREKQLRLGGSTGLRGYKFDSFTGEKAFVFNVEQRLNHPREFFHLLRLGAAFFFDAGAVWAEHETFRFDRVKSDAGLGLRFIPTRSDTGRVGRLDVAYALNGGPGGERWSVSLIGGQAFDLFDNTVADILQGPGTDLTEESIGERLRRR